MKVVFVIDSLKHGGAERVVSELSNCFVLANLNVSIVLLSKIEKPFYKLNEKITISSSYAPLQKKTEKIKALRKTILNENPNIVIAFLPHVCVYTYFAIRKENIPLVVSERNDPSKMSLLLKVLCKHIFKRAEGNVYQTNDAMKWYKNHLSKHSIVIPNPIVLPKKGEFASVNKRKTIIFAGRLQKQKNVEFLIESFSIFLKKHPGYKLKIYGDGYLEETLRKQCVMLKLTSNVVFCGANANWLIDNLDASLFLMTSIYEGMPNSLMEAASHGLNCLSSNCPIGGPKELSILYPNIRLFNTFNSIDVSNQMEKSIFSHTEHEDIWKANEYLSIDNIANLWLNFIRKIAGNE